MGFNSFSVYWAPAGHTVTWWPNPSPQGHYVPMFSIHKFFYTCNLHPLVPSCMGNLSSFLTWESFSKGLHVYCRSLVNVFRWIFQMKFVQTSKLAADFNAGCRMRLYLCLICQARAPLGIESAFWVVRGELPDHRASMMKLAVILWLNLPSVPV